MVRFEHKLVAYASAVAQDAYVIEVFTRPWGHWERDEGWRCVASLGVNVSKVPDIAADQLRYVIQSVARLL